MPEHFDNPLPQSAREWGRGMLFGFSGLDGSTCVASGFSARATGTGYSLAFDTVPRCELKLLPADPGEVVMALNDVLIAETGSGQLILAWSSWHTLIGQLPEQAEVSLRYASGAPSEAQSPWWMTLDRQTGQAVAMLRYGNKLVLCFGNDHDVARMRTEQALLLDLQEVVANRLQVHQALAGGLDRSADSALACKALSVIKANTLMPEGPLNHSWSTPQRLADRRMHLWHSVISSFGMNLLDPSYSWHFLENQLSVLTDEGFLGQWVQVDGTFSTEPGVPMLGWGIYANQQVHHDPAHVRDAMARLDRYLQWHLQHGVDASSQLMCWQSDCAAAMPGSPRFGPESSLLGVDYNVWMALEMHAMARLAELDHDPGLAEQWRAQAHAMTARVHAFFWDDSAGWYMDRPVEDQSASTVQSVTGLLPMLLGPMPDDRVDRIVEAMSDPSRFATPMPVPCISADADSHDGRLWSGGSWPVWTYLAALSLRCQGRAEIARDLVQRCLAGVDAVYRDEGLLWACYDPQLDRSPRELLSDPEVASVYAEDHATASVVLLMLLDQWPALPVVS